MDQIELYRHTRESIIQGMDSGTWNKMTGDARERALLAELKADKNLHPALYPPSDNNATLGPGDTIIVDGAKRDRAVWPGDMGIAVPAAFVSIGDLESVKNGLQVMYNTQVRLNKDNHRYSHHAHNCLGRNWCFC